MTKSYTKAEASAIIAAQWLSGNVCAATYDGTTSRAMAIKNMSAKTTLHKGREGKRCAVGHLIDPKEARAIQEDDSGAYPFASNLVRRESVIITDEDDNGERWLSMVQSAVDSGSKQNLARFVGLDETLAESYPYIL